MRAPRRPTGLALAAWLVLGLCAGCEPVAPAPERGAARAWPVHAGNAGGTRYAALAEITPANVGQLEAVWEYHTGDLDTAETRRHNHSFEATPILVGDALIVCTPRSWVVAIDAETGAERWRYDPEVDLSLGHYNYNCRGVAQWSDRRAEPGASCARRVFVATADARLVALDASRGTPCAGFGDQGAVAFWPGLVTQANRHELGISSPPIVVNDVVVLGSSVSESRRVDMPSGRVQAFDARSGAPLWSFDPVPRDPRDPARSGWAGASADRTGGANVWSLGSADPARDLVFLPTSSPSPDWYGGERHGDNQHADSLVALRASSGEIAWTFQTVHHNIWDYDLGSQPVLIDFPTADGPIPAVAQASKMGHLFFLHRETGEPLIPIEERAVPASDVPGERTSATQPFPSWPPPLVPQRLRPEDAWGLTRWDRGKCRERLESLRNEGIFTPPSFAGSVVFPGTAGGSNWGSVAYDPERKLLFANTSRVANWAQLVPRDAPEAAPREDSAGYLSTAAMRGTPYVAHFGVLLSPLGIPCNPPPWGTLAALDLAAREPRWESVLGTTRDLAPLPLPLPWGTPNMGGPLATAGGLVFIGAALDDYLRAFDSLTGEELWRGRLPAGGQATPMSYRVRDGGRQFVVIAAGGHNQMRSRRGDSLVAFALRN
jgi:quinoprotein glucose dehydrogenase